MYATECFIDTSDNSETGADWTHVLTYYQDGTVEHGNVDSEVAYLLEGIIDSAAENGLDITTAEHYHIMASVLFSRFSGGYAYARHYEVSDG